MFPQPFWSELRSPSSLAADRRRGLAPLERAVVWTVAYADVFDFPRTSAEIHRYLIGVPAAPAAITRAIARAAAEGHLALVGDYVTLAGRTELVDRRAACAAWAARLWPRARSYGALLARLPFVRLVAVSGALAVDNVDARGDIDFFLVTENGRLWTCRALVLVVVRWAARRGDRLCPNYLVTERALALPDRNLFTAHELAQLVPLAGLPLYAQLRQQNLWTRAYLPNAAGPPRQMPAAAGAESALRQIAERLGRSRLGDRVERWERARKVRRFTARAAEGGEARFGADWCKGHFEAHGRRALDAFVARLRRLDLQP
jgi:hypothetical protein